MNQNLSLSAKAKHYLLNKLPILSKVKLHSLTGEAHSQYNFIIKDLSKSTVSVSIEDLTTTSKNNMTTPKNNITWWMRLALTFYLSICMSPCRAMSDDEVLEKTIVPLEKIQLKSNLAAGFEQIFFLKWYGGSFNFGLTPNNWSKQKLVALKNSSIDISRKYEDKDLKQFLLEYEKIKQPYTTDMENVPSNQKDGIKKNLSWWYTKEKSKNLETLLLDPAASQWWEKNIKYLDSATRLMNIARLILQIAPDRFTSADTAILSKLAPIDPNNRTFKNFFVEQHSELDFLIHSDVLREILPNDIDIHALRKLDLEIHARSADALQWPKSDAMSGLDSAIPTLTQGFMWDVATSPSSRLRADIEEISIKLSILGKRLRLVADKTDTCKNTRSLYKESSLKSGWTDWKKMQLQDGSLVINNREAMEKLINGYSLGCFSKARDSATARQLLEAWANQHGDQGRLGATTHCQLAHWYRYGIGGNSDLKKSNEWEKRAFTQAGATCIFRKDNPPPIDPGSPWRELN